MKRVQISDSIRERQFSGSTHESPSVESIRSEPPNNDKGMSLWRYLYIELTRGYWLEYDKAKFTERRKRVYTFLTIPRELEKFVVYGFFQCVDGFLFLFTFLPLRLVKTLFKIFVSCFIKFSWPTVGRVLDPAEICDVLKAVILIVCCCLMNYIDVSMMYHVIRGQTIIKLYLFFNMLDIADKLFTSFGQDILDALFWTATEPRSRRREHFGVIPHLLLAILYVFLHALLVLFQANTLNVAFNSHNKSLLTIMMSNNFVELKGSVFKKFEKNNLFQMSCSDVRERFHFFILLSIVCIRNLTEFSWNTEHFWILIPDILLVMGAEFLVDWVKHAFITKFNEIPYEVYREYTISIAYDMANTRHATAFSDHLDTISRRMGFIPLPLAVLLVRVLGHSVPLKDPFSFLLAGLLFLCLVSFKVLNSIVLLGKSRDLIEENRLCLAAAAAAKSSEPKPADPKPTSKDDLDLPPIRTQDSESDLVSADQSFRRTQSLGNFSATGEDDKISPKLTPSSSTEDLAPLGEGFPRQMSFAAGHLLSNSALNLSSVGMNEDFLEQRQQLEIQQLQQEQAELRKQLDLKQRQQEELEHRQQQLLEMRQRHEHELRQLQQLQEFKLQQQQLELQQQLKFSQQRPQQLEAAEGESKKEEEIKKEEETEEILHKKVVCRELSTGVSKDLEQDSLEVRLKQLETDKEKIEAVGMEGVEHGKVAGESKGDGNMVVKEIGGIEGRNGDTQVKCGDSEMIVGETEGISTKQGENSGASQVTVCDASQTKDSASNLRCGATLHDQSSVYSTAGATLQRKSPVYSTDGADVLDLTSDSEDGATQKEQNDNSGVKSSVDFVVGSLTDTQDDDDVEYVKIGKTSEQK